jgi:hypothetical protein
MSSICNNFNDLSRIYGSSLKFDDFKDEAYIRGNLKGNG